MKKAILATLLSFSAYGQAEAVTAPDLNGRWRGEMSGDLIQLDVQHLTGVVTGTAALNFDWNTAERHFNVTGQANTEKAILHLLDARGRRVYLLSCQFSHEWQCTLDAETGVTEPLPGTAMSTARAWTFQLNAVQ